MAISGSNELLTKISSQIETQFPGFVREEGPQFVAFLKAYFEYMEQDGNAVKQTRSLQNNIDIDRTVDSFVEYFRKEFMINIPSTVLADKRLLVKHIREFYRSRGSQESYRFLFRTLYGKELDFYYPGDDILRASDGRWFREVRLRVGAPFNINPRTFEGKRIRGLTSGATAFIQDIICKDASGLTVYDLNVEQVIGTFSDGERIVDIDNTNNYATVNAQSGSLVSVSVIDGGAYNSIGDIVRIDGAGSTQAATGIVTEVKNEGAVTLKIAKGGNGYTKDGSKLIISGGNGTGFEASIASFSSEPIAGLSINTDLIGPMKNIPINAGRFFVQKGQNTASVATKLTGTVKITSGSLNVIGQGTNFITQLAIGDLVRIPGCANTLRVSTISTAQSFAAVYPSPVTITTPANAYIGLAAANAYTRLVSALKFSSTDIFSINAISITNPGYGYTVLPTVRIEDTTVSRLNISDTYGNIIGNNCVIVANTAPGTATKISISEPGSNFSKSGVASITNITKTTDSITDSYIGSRVSGAANTKYTIRTKSFDSTASIKPSGFIVFPGRYIDTKGFLSWNNRLQDNYYYQEFSYVVRLTETVDKYKEIVKSLLHPAGTIMFGDYIIPSMINVQPTIIDSAAVVVRRSVLERITATSSQTSTAEFTNGMNVTEPVTSTASHTATFTANTSRTESVTSVASHTATFVANTEISESTTVDVSHTATFVANTQITESVTSTAAHTATFTANTRITETVTSTATHTGTFVANSQITESVTTTETRNATFVANSQITETVTSTATHTGTFVANTQITESVTSTAAHTGGFTANTSRAESVTSVASHTATFTANTSRTESVTVVASHQGQRFAIMSSVYGVVQYANSVISVYASSQIAPYAGVPVGALDGTPRLVTSGSIGAKFANGALKANTGTVSVGGVGSNLYIITTAGVPVDGSPLYQVNAIFSNTAFTIRTNFVPTSANVRIWYSTGP